MKGLDQTALAERLGISRSSMSRILSGAQEPKLRLAYDLAKALGVSLDYLVDDTMEDEPGGQLVMVSEDEMTILKIVRRLGTDVAIDRLLDVAGSSARAESSLSEGQAGRLGAPRHRGHDHS